MAPVHPLTKDRGAEAIGPVTHIMNAQLFAPENRPPLVVIETLIADHGVWRTFRAFVTALARRDRHVVLTLNHNMNDHLRRDIGLEPDMPGRKYWELRL